MGKINSRQKGAAAEREIAKILRDCGYKGARRSQQYSGFNGDADVVGVEGLHLEIKRVESLNLDKAYEQATGDSKGNIPVVVHRRSRKPWKVTIGLEDFIKIYQEYERGNVNE